MISSRMKDGPFGGHGAARRPGIMGFLCDMHTSVKDEVCSQRPEGRGRGSTACDRQGLRWPLVLALMAGLLAAGPAAAEGPAPSPADTRAIAEALARENVSHLMPFATDPDVRRFLMEEALPYFDLNRVIEISTDAYLKVYDHEELVFLRNALKDPLARGVLLKFNDMSLAVTEPVNGLLTDAIRCTPVDDRPPQLAALGEHLPAERAAKCGEQAGARP